MPNREKAAEVYGGTVEELETIAFEKEMQELGLFAEELTAEAGEDWPEGMNVEDAIKNGLAGSLGEEIKEFCQEEAAKATAEDSSAE